MVKRGILWTLGLVGWIFACVGAIGIVDQSITLTHYKAKIESTSSRAQLLEFLVSNGIKGKTRDDMVALLRSKFSPDRMLDKNNGDLLVDGVELLFRNGEFVGIRPD